MLDLNFVRLTILFFLNFFHSNLKRWCCIYLTKNLFTEIYIYFKCFQICRRETQFWIQSKRSASNGLREKSARDKELRISRRNVTTWGSRSSRTTMRRRSFRMRTHTSTILMKSATRRRFSLAEAGSFQSTTSMIRNLTLGWKRVRTSIRLINQRRTRVAPTANSQNSWISMILATTARTRITSLRPEIRPLKWAHPPPREKLSRTVAQAIKVQIRICRQLKEVVIRNRKISLWLLSNSK